MAQKSRRSQIVDALRVLAPGIPRYDLDAAADRAVDSPGLRTASPPAAAWLALVAHVRHVYTDYDQLMDDGYDRDSARFFVLEEINATLGGWDCRRAVSGEDAEDADTLGIVE